MSQLNWAMRRRKGRDLERKIREREEERGLKRQREDQGPGGEPREHVAKIAELYRNQKLRKGKQSWGAREVGSGGDSEMC